MVRLLCLLAAALLAGCARSAPPAPVYYCRSGTWPVVIDGATQPGIATWCRTPDGSAALRG
jgi:surface antigen